MVKKVVLAEELIKIYTERQNLLEMWANKRMDKELSLKGANMK